jgi:DNA-binding winged helix-turn-helix (wHTH) protein
MIAPHLLAFADFQLDPASGDLYGPSGLIRLPPKVLALLGYLATHPNRLVSKRELLDVVWPDVFVTDSVLKVAVRQVRQALGDDAHSPRFVETAHRRGYRFIAPVRHVPTTTTGQDLPVSCVVVIAPWVAMPLLLSTSDVGGAEGVE